MRSVFPRLFSVGIFAASVFAVPLVAYPQQGELVVIVTDQAGGRVSDARVVTVDASGRRSHCSGSEGEFLCSADERASVEVISPGFTILRRKLSSVEMINGRLTLILEPAGVREQVVVTAGRTATRLGDTPLSIVSIGRDTIEVTAAPTLDETLRQVPGFSTFRRTGSRYANPTTQGVSLRGTGSSGASRSLVLFEGVPLNDPFGGWVQWNRIALIAVEQAEVLRGGASSLYGNSSLSGVVNVLPRRSSENRVFSAEFFGGTQRTISGSGFAGIGYKGWRSDLSAALFQTRGYIPVDSPDRGPVDSTAGVRSSNVSGRFSTPTGRWGSIFVRPSYFGEVRSNGTGLQTNRTHSRQLSVGGRFAPFASADTLQPRLEVEWRMYGGTQVYDQNFSAVNPTRTSENLTRIQRSPSQFFGFGAQAVAAVRGHLFVAGVEGRKVRGSSDEVVFAAGSPVSLVGSGGRESTISVFAQDIIPIGDRIIISGSIRYDRWRNHRGQTVTRNLVTGALTGLSFPDRTDDALSPQIGFLIRATGRLSFHASASRSFRAPTLNELYRGFRVGNVVTNANENLRAERAANFETGASFASGRTYLRSSFFVIAIDNAIANVTLTSTPTLITRQRQNAGRTRTIGVEIDAETRFGSITLSGGYLFSDSRVMQFATNPVLEGKFVPQVARHQMTFQIRYPAFSWDFAVQGRVAGRQYDDDLNLFRLEPYFQLDIFVSRRIGEKLRLFGAIENVINSRYSVGRTPVRTVNSPINVRLGLRWN
jgi:outer membrane receptor protein involved in Fe transport